MLTYREGCDIIMRQTGEDTYFGGTSTCDCTSTGMALIHMSKRGDTTKDEYHVVDKGLHKENHSKVWGSDYGAFKFVRQ